MFISTAWAQAGGGGGGGDIFTAMLPLVLIFAVFYFLLIRPQQKKMKTHTQMIGNLRRGDKIVTGGGVFGRCRCAPRPDALGWPSPSPRRSHLLARRRTARDSLNGIRRARAASMLSRHELSHRAFFPACTFGLRCRGLWRCVVVVSSRASESVVVCTCVFRTQIDMSVCHSC